MGLETNIKSNIKNLICGIFNICFYSTLDVGRSMLDVHLLKTCIYALSAVSE